MAVSRGPVLQQVQVLLFDGTRQWVQPVKCRAVSHFGWSTVFMLKKDAQQSEQEDVPDQAGVQLKAPTWQVPNVLHKLHVRACFVLFCVGHFDCSRPLSCKIGMWCGDIPYQTANERVLQLGQFQPLIP